jgi:hypothetical protein
MMKPTRITRNIVLAVVALFAPFTARALEADPPKLLINSLGSAVVVWLSDNGAPLAASDFKAFRFMVDDSNYSRMVTVTPVEGGVRVAPTESFEVGSYDLVLETKKGVITVPVSAPLSGEEGVLEQRTKDLGGAKQEAMQDLGLSSPLPRGVMGFTLAPQYPVGDVLQIDAPKTPGAAFRWLVNGEVVAEGTEANLRYPLAAEGDYLVRLEQRSPGGAWEKLSEGSTLATEQEPVPVAGKVGQRINFKAPEGFGKYTWTLAGKLMSEQRTVGLGFPTAGKHELICRCEQPVNGPEGGFRVVRYVVTIP